MIEKQFHLKIKWKNREKTEAYEIVLYDDGQPLCELISVDDARLVRDVLNEQDERIKALETENELKGDFRNFINEDIVRMKKENEQLKSTNMEMEDYLGRLEKENKQLKEENSYLNKELDYYYGRSVIND